MQIGAYSSSVYNYNQSITNMQKLMLQIATSKKINSAADDAATLAISQGMLGQVNGLAQAYDNTGNAISMLNTAEGAMGDSTAVLQRMRELSIQAGNGILTDSDRASLQQEMNQLNSQLNTNANNTEFNTIKTNDGSLNNAVIQVGANTGQTTSFSIANTSADGLSLSADVSTQAAAASTLTSIDSAIQQLSTNRSQIGAVTNGLEYSREYAAQAGENLESAYSTSSDADIALTATKLSQAQIQAYVNIMTLSKTMNMQQGALSLLP